MDLEKSFRLLRLFALVPFLFGPADLNAHDAEAVLAGEATVYENQTDNNGGGDSQVCIGNIATDVRRAFVRYTLPAIAAGSTVYRVVWAILQDQVSDPGPGPLAATLQVRRVTSAWVEGTGSGGGSGPCDGGENVAGVDWATQPTVAAADSAAAALSADDQVNVVIDTGFDTGNDGLIADVQAWVDNGATNFGWRLAVVEEGTADNARALTPGTLTIHWTPPGEDHLFSDGFETP